MKRVKFLYSEPQAWHVDIESRIGIYVVVEFAREC